MERGWALAEARPSSAAPLILASPRRDPLSLKLLSASASYLYVLRMPQLRTPGLSIWGFENTIWGVVLVALSV